MGTQFEYDGQIFRHGDSVTLDIDDDEILDARINVTRNIGARDGFMVYFCQDVKDGTRPDDTLGYRFAWAAHMDPNGSLSDGVRNLRHKISSAEEFNKAELKKRPLKSQTDK